MVPNKKVFVKVFAATILFLTVGCSSSNSMLFNVSQITASFASDKSKDTSIIPGERVGAVTKKTTRADLVKMFGASKLEDKVVLEDEGTISVPATKVNLDKERYFTVVWEEDTRENLLYVTDFGSAWKITEGIGIGTSFSELQQKLGDFKLTGLGWDYGGFIELENTPLSKYQGLLSIQLAANQQAIKKHSQQYEAVLNDQVLSANNPNWQPLDMKVSRMTVHFE